MVLSMERWIGKIAIVTGASSGIGAAIVRRLLEENVVVVGLARRKEKVEEISKSKNLHALRVDLSIEDDILRAFKWVKENLGPIHILVNSAGIFRFTDYLDGETKMWTEMMNVNYIALCVVTREAVKDMRENGVDGHVIHINDISGSRIYGIKYFNVYAATRFSISAAVEGLRVELNDIGSKIKVSSINPGFVDTEILKNSTLGDPDMQEYAKQFENLEAILDPDDIADAVTYLISTPQHVQVHDMTITAVGEKY